jgi:membrane protease YdiL (CAAX protease family)
MTFNWFENSSPASKIVLSLAFMVSILIIGFFIGLIIAMPLFGKGIFEIIKAGNNLSNPENIGILRYIQTVQSISLFIIPPILLAFLFGSNPSNYLKLKKHPKLISVLIVSALIIVAIPFINFTEMINSKLSLPTFLSGVEQWMKNAEESAKMLTEAFLNTNTISSLMVNLFVMAIIPAIGEELVFRGLFQRLFTEWFKNVHWGIIASAAVFSAFHFQFYGFIPRMLLGVVFGYFLVWSGSLWLPIAAHFVNNTLGILYFFLLHNGYVSDRLDKLGTEGATSTSIIIFSILLSASMIFLLKKSIPESRLK